MACLVLNKFLCCMKLRIGVFVMGFLFLLWKLKLLYHDVSTFFTLFAFLVQYSDADEITFSLESQITLGYGAVHLILAVIDLILAIVLAVGLFNEKKTRLIKVFYDGVIGTVVINIVAFAIIAYLQLVTLGLTVTNAMMAYVLAEFGIGTILVIYLIIVTRSYYYKITYDKDDLLTPVL